MANTTTNTDPAPSRADAAPAADEVQWLSESEQHAWRGFVSGVTSLMGSLERHLAQEHDLSMDDYAILVLLSESPGRELRMSRIADDAIVPRPQVTYRINRLEKRGVVERHPCPDDARGTLAHLTDAGFDLLERAARTHVTNVRDQLLEHVTPEEFEVLGRAMGRVHRALLQQEARRA